MNKVLRLIVLLVTSTTLTACLVAQPKESEIQSANYGPKVPQWYMLEAVKGYMSRRLIDPASATYECSTPKKAWLTANASEEGNVQFGRTYYGYHSVCLINAKNRFGGYTGAKQYTFMIYQANGQGAIAHFDGFAAGEDLPE